MKKGILLALVLAFLFPSAASASAPPILLKKVALPCCGAYSIVVSGEIGMVYADGSFISLDSLSPTFRVDGGQTGFVRMLGVDPSVNEAYTTADGYLVALDAISGTERWRVWVAHQLLGFAAEPSRNRLYVALTYQDSILVINRQTRSVEKVISVESPQGIAVDRSRGRIYVGTVASPSAGGAIVAIDTALDQVVASVPASFSTFVAVDEVTDSVYVRRDEAVLVLRGSNLTQVATLPVGGGPAGIAVDKIRRRVWVANRVADAMTLIDADSLQILGTADACDNPLYVDVDMLTGRAYTGCVFDQTVAILGEQVPTVSITSPKPLYASTNGSTVVAGRAPAGSSVSIIDGGSILADAIAGSDGAWSVPFQFSEGRHSLTARVAGDASLPQTIYVDRAAPTIALEWRSRPNSGGWDDPYAVVNWSCKDSLTDVLTPWMQRIIQGVEGREIPVKVTCEDWAGNLVSDTRMVNIDSRPPGIEYLGQDPAPKPSGWTNALPVRLTWRCSDAVSGPREAAINALITSEGSHQVTGTCWDQAGHTATNGQSVNVDVTSPTSSVDQPSMPIVLSTVTRLSGRATDNLSGVASTLVRFEGATGETVSVVAHCDLGCGTTHTFWSVSVPFLKPGIYGVGAASADRATNAGGWSMPVTLIVV
jgi:YVTN family beta-propeller protein